jgi:dienelactone hydrolase
MSGPHRQRYRIDSDFGFPAWALVACAVCALAPGCDRPPASHGDSAEDARRARERLLVTYEYTPRQPALQGPLAFETLESGLRVARFELEGENRRRVRAVLAIPPGPRRGTSRAPVVVYLHRAAETPEAAIDVARAFGAAGPAVLAISVGAEEWSASANPKREAFARDRAAVLDARSALDAVAEIDGLDPERIVVMGASQGAGPACIAGGVDPRVVGVVSIAGGVDPASGLRARLPAGEAAEGPRSAAIDRVDPRLFLPFLEARPILFVQASRDATPRARVDSLIAAARENKKVVWLDEEHQFPFERAAPAVRDWLARELSW